MKNCCENKDEELAVLRSRQSNVLKTVFFINFIMFFVEFISGWKSNSTALMGDSLDMLGDAFVYGFSLYVLYRSAKMRIRAAQIKGVIMLLFGLIVLFEAIHKLVTGTIPISSIMGLIGSIALGTNLICLFILYSHKEDDLNMKSTWICSRNDIVANLGTIGAAYLVAKLNSFWPDVIVGTIIAVLFLTSAIGVLQDSFKEMRRIN